MRTRRLIETDVFPFEFLSLLAERESWRKEVHRPLSYLHKWWAKRLGSVFRGILLGCAMDESANLAEEFYRQQSVRTVVLDPFVGSGTTLYEAHKLGCAVLGRDINPVAVEAVRTALGPMERDKLQAAYERLASDVGAQIRSLYRSRDSKGRVCDVLYYFWVMRTTCPSCLGQGDLFPSWVIARNAYPARRPEAQLLCPSCKSVFPGLCGDNKVECPTCGFTFRAETGTSRKAAASCLQCGHTYRIIGSTSPSGPPRYRMYAKLVLTEDGAKEYLAATEEDTVAYTDSRQRLELEVASGTIKLPSLSLADGYNTRQALNYGFTSWRDFFNDRQLLALGKLHRAIADLSDEAVRDVFFTLFSGILEFNNMFASYKGEGTGAVRHMFSNHVLRPERTPIEANVWGTSESSGSFSGMFRTRLLRAIAYREAPWELHPDAARRVTTASLPFRGHIESGWPANGEVRPGEVYVSQGDSSELGLPDAIVDVVVTDPPFFDNVHYSELADFFYAWQQLYQRGTAPAWPTTRMAGEVQDTDPQSFEHKLTGVFSECHRVTKDDGLLVFTFHHSRDEAWVAVARSILRAGYVVVNAHPVKSEMSVAAPKAQAKEPIQLDMIIVCRKAVSQPYRSEDAGEALRSAYRKAGRLLSNGFLLSRNDLRVILAGQLLATVRSMDEVPAVIKRMSTEPLDPAEVTATSRSQAVDGEQLTLLLGDAGSV